MNKTFYTQNNIGNAKYVVNFHNGVSAHRDGSEFFDIAIFKSKAKLKECIDKLLKEGYVERGISLTAPKIISNISELKEGKTYHFKSKFGEFQATCIGKHGVGEKVYFTRGRETNLSMSKKFERNILPDCFVCWSLEIGSEYIIKTLN